MDLPVLGPGAEEVTDWRDARHAGTRPVFLIRSAGKIHVPRNVIEVGRGVRWAAEQHIYRAHSAGL